MIVNENKVTILTGGQGQDGSYLSELLLEKNYTVVCCRRRSSSDNLWRVQHLLDNPKFKLEYFDVNDSSIYELISKYSPDEIYHLAAQSDVAVSFENPEYTVSSIVNGTLKILEAIRWNKKHNWKSIKFYNAASSEMMGYNIQVPQNENSIFMPASPYGCAKVCAYHLVKNYRDSYGLFASSGILYNHETSRRGLNFVTRKITHTAAKIKMGLASEIRLGNLDAKRDWGHGKDSVRAMHLILQHNEPDDFVIATGKSHTVKEFLELVFDYAGLDYKKYLVIDPTLFRPKEVPYLLGDATKARDKLGWKPEYTIEQMAKEMYDSDWNLLCKQNTFKESR